MASLRGVRQKQHRAQAYRGRVQVFLRSPEHGAGGQGEVLVYACSWWSAAEARPWLVHARIAWHRVQHRQQRVRHRLEHLFRLAWPKRIARLQ